MKYRRHDLAYKWLIILKGKEHLYQMDSPLRFNMSNGMKKSLMLTLTIALITLLVSNVNAQKALQLTNQKGGRKLLMQENSRVLCVTNDSRYLGILSSISDSTIVVSGKTLGLTTIQAIGKRRRGSGFLALPKGGSPARCWRTPYSVLPTAALPVQIVKRPRKTIPVVQSSKPSLVLVFWFWRSILPAEIRQRSLVIGN